MVYLCEEVPAKAFTANKIISEDGMKKRKMVQQRTEQSLASVPPTTKIILRLFIVHRGQCTGSEGWLNLLILGLF